jgi:hypothetical protein
VRQILPITHADQDTLFATNMPTISPAVWREKASLVVGSSTVLAQSFQADFRSIGTTVGGLAAFSAM